MNTLKALRFICHQYLKPHLLNIPTVNFIFAMNLPPTDPSAIRRTNGSRTWSLPLGGADADAAREDATKHVGWEAGHEGWVVSWLWRFADQHEPWWDSGDVPVRTLGWMADVGWWESSWAYPGTMKIITTVAENLSSGERARLFIAGVETQQKMFGEKMFCQSMSKVFFSWPGGARFGSSRSSSGAGISVPKRLLYSCDVRGVWFTMYHATVTRW